MMASLSKEQKLLLKSLYRNSERVVKLESHLEFLSQSLHLNFIPKRFKVKNNLPGNPELNERRLNEVSIQSIQDEKRNHENSLKAANADFEKAKSKLYNMFDVTIADDELKRVFEHVDKVKIRLKQKKNKKNS